MPQVVKAQVKDSVTITCILEQKESFAKTFITNSGEPNEEYAMAYYIYDKSLKEISVSDYESYVAFHYAKSAIKPQTTKDTGNTVKVSTFNESTGLVETAILKVYEITLLKKSKCYIVSFKPKVGGYSRDIKDFKHNGTVSSLISDTGEIKKVSFDPSVESLNCSASRPPHYGTTPVTYP